MKRFAIAVLGGAIILLGLALLVLPGPGALIITAGLAILATEFLWARSAMRRAKGAVSRVRRRCGLKFRLPRHVPSLRRQTNPDPSNGNP